MIGRAEGQRQRDRQPVEQVRPDRLAGDERVAEAGGRAVLDARAVVVVGADEDALQPVASTARQIGSLKPSSLGGRGDLLRVGGPADVAGGQALRRCRRPSAAPGRRCAKVTMLTMTSMSSGAEQAPDDVRDHDVRLAAAGPCRVTRTGRPPRAFTCLTWRVGC